MDQTRIEQLGAKPLAFAVDQVRAAKTRDDLAAFASRNASNLDGTLFTLNIDADLKNPERETRIAGASWTKVQERDTVAMYNPVQVAELASFAPGFGWSGFLMNAGLSKIDGVIVGDKGAFPNLAAIWAAEPVETLQAWQAAHIADNAAPYLSKAFADAYFEMRGKTLAGQKEQQVRWKRGVLEVSGGDLLVGDRLVTFGTLGFGVGQFYTAKYFGPEARATIKALVVNLKAPFRSRLEKLDWMGPQTKNEAVKKLDTYTIKVGHPDHPRDYSGLAIAADDLVGNVRRAAATDLEFYVGRLGGFAQQGLLASSRAGAFSPSFFRNGKSSLDHFERSQRHRSGPLWRVILGANLLSLLSHFMSISVMS